MKIFTLDKLKKFADALFARVERDARPNPDNMTDTWENWYGAHLSGSGIAGTRIHGVLANDAIVTGSNIMGEITSAYIKGSHIIWSGANYIPGTVLTGSIPGSRINWYGASRLPGSLTEINDQSFGSLRAATDSSDFSSGALIINYPSGNFKKISYDILMQYMAPRIGSRLSNIPSSAFSSLPGSKINWDGATIPGTHVANIQGSTIFGTIFNAQIEGYNIVGSISGSQITGTIWGGLISGDLSNATISGSRIMGEIPGSRIDWDNTTIPGSRVNLNGASSIPGSKLDYVPGHKIDWGGATIPGSRLDYVSGSKISGQITNATLPSKNINWLDVGIIPGSQIRGSLNKYEDVQVPAEVIVWPDGKIPGTLIDWDYNGVPGSKISWIGAEIPGLNIAWGSAWLPGSRIDWSGGLIPGTLIDWTGVQIPASAIAHVEPEQSDDTESNPE